jgi:hypothetical protein
MDGPGIYPRARLENETPDGMTGEDRAPEVCTAAGRAGELLRTPLREAAMKAKLLCDAGEITRGEDVEVITKAKAPKPPQPRKPRTKAKAPQPRKPRAATGLEYKVRDDAGHEESVATSDLQVVL